MEVDVLGSSGGGVSVGVGRGGREDTDAVDSWCVGERTGCVVVS